jgi:hypothetical protein
MPTNLVQFFLIDHIAATGGIVFVVCVALKVWILYNCPSHPFYRGHDAD